MKKMTNKKAFTLIELIVALGLVAAMLAGSGYIFSVAASSQKIARATGDVMDKLRIITAQLDQDFAGLQKDMPILVRFDRYDKDEDGDGVAEEHRADQIMFFATGDFSSLRRYELAYKSNWWDLPIKGQSARLQYGISRPYLEQNGENYDSSLDYEYIKQDKTNNKLSPNQRILTRRQHIYSPNIALDGSDFVYWHKEFPEVDDSKFEIYDKYEIYKSLMSDSGAVYWDQALEHENILPNVWQKIPLDHSSSNNDYKDAVIPACFEKYVDTDKEDSSALPKKRFHTILSESVSDFKIQFAYQIDNSVNADEKQARWLWFPSSDPDLDTNDTDSHFKSPTATEIFHSSNQDLFGVLLNLDKDNSKVTGTELIDMGSNYKWYKLENYDRKPSTGNTFKQNLLKAIKFTFTLHDSNNEFEDGKTFTHIIYLDN